MREIQNIAFWIVVNGVMIYEDYQTNAFDCSGNRMQINTIVMDSGLFGCSRCDVRRLWWWNRWWYFCGRGCHFDVYFSAAIRKIKNFNSTFSHFNWPKWNNWVFSVNYRYFILILCSRTKNYFDSRLEKNTRDNFVFNQWMESSAHTCNAFALHAPYSRVESVVCVLDDTVSNYITHKDEQNWPIGSQAMSNSILSFTGRTTQLSNGQQ